MQHAFIIKTKKGSPGLRYAQTSRLHVSYPEINRPTGRSMNLPGFGSARFVEGTGRYNSKTLTIAAQALRGPDGSVYGNGARQVNYGSGQKTSGSNVYVYPRNDAAALKTVIRRIRPEEAAELDLIDEEIADLERQVKEARTRRAVATARAWTKAHSVRLNEVQPLKGENKRIVEVY